MKLIYLHQYFSTPDSPGGTRSFEFARRLVSAGIDVHMVTSVRNAPRTGSWSTKVVEGITVHSVSVPYGQYMSFPRRIAAFVEFAAKASVKARSLHGDVVFGTSTPLTIALPALYATALRKTPFVLEIRDLWPKVPVAMGALRNPLSRYAARALERLSYNMADAIIALSPDMERGIVDVAPHRRRGVTVIPNAADIDFFNRPATAARSWREDHPEIGDSPFILYAGALGKVNNPIYLVDLAENLKAIDSPLKVVVLGSGSEEGDVRKRAEAVGVLGNQLVLLEPIAKDKLPDAYAAASMAISTVAPIEALYANSANKFFDALAAGKPAIINHPGWMKKVLEDADAGIAVSTTDAKQAAAELNALLQDKPRLKTMSANAQSLAESQFSRDTLATELLLVLRRAERSPHRPARRNRSCR